MINERLKFDFLPFARTSIITKEGFVR